MQRVFFSASLLVAAVICLIKQVSRVTQLHILHTRSLSENMQPSHLLVTKRTKVNDYM